jgi:NitT/TauT family transport system permease protein
MSVGELTTARTFDPAPAPPSLTTRRSAARVVDRQVWTSIGWTIGAVLAVVALWELAKAGFGASDTTLPHVWSVLTAFGETLPNGDNRAVSLLQAIGVTLQEAVAGLGVGIVIGAAVGVLSAKSRFASFTLTPVLVATQTFPLVAIVPALVILLGDGWVSLALIAAILAFFPIYVAVARAIADTGRDQRELFRSCGLSKVKVFTSLEMPRATLAVVGTIRTATALAVVGAIVAELPSGRPSGISMTLLSAASYYLTDPEALWCAALTAMAGGVVLVYVMSGIASVAARFALRIPAQPKEPR